MLLERASGSRHVRIGQLVSYSGIADFESWTMPVLKMVNEPLPLASVVWG